MIINKQINKQIKLKEPNETKYIKREGPTTRGREKAQSQAPLTPLNTHEDSDSDDDWSDDEELSVSFDDHVEVHEF